MSRKIFIDAFYNQFGEFLSQLTRVFPDDTDLPAFKTGLVLIQRTNPMLAVKTVYQHTLPYSEIIRAKNEDFFLKHEFSDISSGDDALEQIIRKLKGLWETLSDTNKQCIWDYLILILDLAKRCIDLSS